MEYIILIISILAIVYGADNLVSGAVTIARKFKISDFVIGAVIVGIGTSLPELFVSADGAWQGRVDVAIGNVVGSNIFNILGILGLTAIIYPLPVARGNMRFELPYCIFVSVLAMLLTYNFFNDDTLLIGRVDGVIFLLLFAAFLYMSFLRDKRQAATLSATTDNATTVPEPSVGNVWLATLRVVGGLVVLIAGCHYFVEEAVVLATQWGVDEAFISITLIACGTSLPELSASLVAAFKRNTDLALGNVVGSNIFNITFILGVSSQISPLSGGGITPIDYAVMIGAAMLLFLFGLSGRISRLAGLVMLAAFVAYNYYLILPQIQ